MAIGKNATMPENFIRKIKCRIINWIFGLSVLPFVVYNIINQKEYLVSELIFALILVFLANVITILDIKNNSFYRERNVK